MNGIVFIIVLRQLNSQFNLLSSLQLAFAESSRQWRSRGRLARCLGAVTLQDGRFYHHLDGIVRRQEKVCEAFSLLEDYLFCHSSSLAVLGQIEFCLRDSPVLFLTMHDHK